MQSTLGNQNSWRFELTTTITVLTSKQSNNIDKSVRISESGLCVSKLFYNLFFLLLNIWQVAKLLKETIVQINECVLFCCKITKYQIPNSKFNILMCTIRIVCFFLLLQNLIWFANNLFDWELHCFRCVTIYL